MIAAVIAAGTVLLELGIPQIVNQFADGGSIVGWLPQLDAVGQTVVAYVYVSQALTFILVVGGVAGLGYWIGMRLDVSREYRAVFGSFALGSGIGYLCGMVLFGTLFGGLSIPTDLFLESSFILGMALATAVQFGLIGFAGAALAQFGFARTSSRTDVHGADSRSWVDID